MPKVLRREVTSCIIDTESVAWDRDKGQILPFQVLSTRKRKDADVSSIKVQVCVFAFDLIYLNGQSLVKEPLEKRRELLHSSFNEVEGVSNNTQNSGQITQLFLFLLLFFALYFVLGIHVHQVSGLSWDR
jgi:DNA ligase-1